MENTRRKAGTDLKGRDGRERARMLLEAVEPLREAAELIVHAEQGGIPRKAGDDAVRLSLAAIDGAMAALLELENDSGMDDGLDVSDLWYQAARLYLEAAGAQVAPDGPPNGGAPAWWWLGASIGAFLRDVDDRAGPALAGAKPIRRGPLTLV